KIRKLLHVSRRTGVVLFKPKMRRSKAEGKRHLESSKRFHLAIEPFRCIGSEGIRPTKTCANMSHAMFFHPRGCLLQPVIFKMKPLAESHATIARELLSGQFRPSVA